MMAFAQEGGFALAPPATVAEARLAGLAEDLARSTGVDATGVQRSLLLLIESFSALDEAQRAQLVGRWLADWQGAEPHTDVALKAFAFQQAPSRANRDRLVDAIVRGRWAPQVESFLYWQLVRLAFLRPQFFPPDEAGLVLRRFHRRRVKAWARRINRRFGWLPPERRNRRLVLMSRQFVSIEHAPSRDLLDYAAALAELGWEVEIIISFEMPRDLPLPFPEPFLAARDSRISGADRIAWKDHQFPCWQIPGAMPTERGLVTFLQTVARKKPLAILDIGGNGVAADLASQITTTVALPLSVQPPIAETTFIATVGREHETGLGPAPVREELDLDAGRFLPFRYAYRLPESGGTVPEALDSIPADRIRGVIVGSRLDKEISGANLDLLLSSLERVPQLHLVFVGPFKSFDMLAARHRLLGARATALGLQRDVVAILRRCHLYLNPRRAGGGSSVAHALGCGLPVVTFADGDGAYAAGPAFAVDSAADYLARVECWAGDPAARAAACARAQQRWEEISDRAASLKALLEMLQDDDRLARRAPLFVGRRPGRNRSR